LASRCLERFDVIFPAGNYPVFIPIPEQVPVRKQRACLGKFLFKLVPIETIVNQERFLLLFCPAEKRMAGRMDKAIKRA